MSKESVLKSIRRGVAADPEAAVELPSGYPPMMSVSERVSRFRKELEAVEGTFIDARPSSARPSVGSALKQILETTGSETIHWESWEALEEAGLEASDDHETVFSLDRLVLSRHREGRLQTPIRLETEERTRERLDAMTLVVSQAAWGIAETGTVIHQSGPGTGRLMSILPPNHVLLLSEARLLETPLRFFKGTELGATGSATLFITGPSRTADIEKVLVTGVHGPRRLFVILTSPDHSGV